MNAEAAELFDQNGALIRASEGWSKEYKKDSTTFGRLLKNESKMERLMYGYFKDLAERAPQYVDWNAYNRALQEVKAAAAPDLSVLISDDEVNYEDSLVMKLMFDPIDAAIQIGAEAAAKIYNRPLKENELRDAIMKVARQKTAELVGKRVDKEGNIIDNPNSEYSIGNTTRQAIRNSIRNSLSLGETQEEATARINDVIKDKDRAAKIASTEAVNGYQGGMFTFAKTSGAVMKEWQTIAGACVVCEGNADEGPIPIDALFQSGDDAPSAHPWDRCGLRYIYQEELDAADNS